MIQQWKPDYDDYLRDESRRTGTAESISFPTSEAEVVEVVRAIRAQGRMLTTQGARTGLTAGAVPQGGHVLNLSRMNAIRQVGRDETTGEHRIKVQPGALLSEVRKAVEKENIFFPPDPTETSASIGGMASCNASGALSFFYGSTRDWIASLRAVLSSGETIHLARGRERAAGRSFSLTTETGRAIEGSLPSYILPKVKSAAGYYVADDMDMIDLFIGMEGTLAVITEIELKLIPKPRAISGLTVFFPSEDAAITFVRILRGEQVEGFDQLDACPAAIEFFNHDSLHLLRTMKSGYPAFSNIPPIKPHYHTAVYIEYHGGDEDDVEANVMHAIEAATQLGSSDDDTWYATTERELEPLKSFRHAVPEAVNLLIDERRRKSPELAKLGTDMSVPDEHLRAVMQMYNSDLKESRLDFVIFGHIGNNHLHVNILPNNPDEYERGRRLYLSWAKQIVELGGSVSAEHGIGKTKVPFLELMYGPEVIKEMRKLKLLFDPEMMLNPGNLLP